MGGLKVLGGAMRKEMKKSKKVIPFETASKNVVRIKMEVHVKLHGWIFQDENATSVMANMW